MKDLEIRGAGNLLGGEQSGHIAGVGFDLYVRLVGEAVADFRGDGDDGAGRDQDRAAGRRPPAARLRAGRAAAARGLQEAGHRRATRPGSPRSRPSCATATAPCPSRCATCWRWPGCAPWPAQAGVADIGVQGNYVRFGPVELPESQQLRLQRLYPGSLVKDAVAYHSRARSR